LRRRFFTHCLLRSDTNNCRTGEQHLIMLMMYHYSRHSRSERCPLYHHFSSVCSSSCFSLFGFLKKSLLSYMFALSSLTVVLLI
jgi:hypothetical protein